MPDLEQERKARQDMWDKPRFDPYDAIQELMQLNVQHQQNILELNRILMSQAKQIEIILKAIRDHREHIGNIITMLEHKQDK